MDRASADLIVVFLAENAQVENGVLSNGAYLAAKLAELFDAGKLNQGASLRGLYEEFDDEPKCEPYGEKMLPGASGPRIDP